MKTAEEILDELLEHDGIGSPEDIRCYVSWEGYSLDELWNDRSVDVRCSAAYGACKAGRIDLLKKLAKDEAEEVRQAAINYLHELETKK